MQKGDFSITVVFFNTKHFEENDRNYQNRWANTITIAA